MKKLGSLFVGAALVAMAAPAFASNDIEITSLRGYGNGCKSRSNGSPVGWAYTVSSDRKTFSVDFSNMISDKKARSVKCTLLMNVKFPPGKTVYDYSSQFRGEAVVGNGDSGNIRARVRLGTGNWKNVSKDLRGTDGGWSTRVGSRADQKTAGCGGRDYTVTVEISARTSGNGYVAIESGDGRMSNIRIKAKDCE